MLTSANNLHSMDCEETKMLNPQHRGFTIETAENLWGVVQLDNFAGSHHIKDGYSPSTAEVNQGILRSWIQYFGYPKCFKLGTKGGHRGRDLEQWGDTHAHTHTHGVEMEFVPTEAHGQIGKVESLAGSLKQKLQAHLRGAEDDPIATTWAMIAAHNSMSRRGG